MCVTSADTTLRDTAASTPTTRQYLSETPRHTTVALTRRERLVPTMPAATIRDATHADVADIRAVADATWRATYDDVFAPATIDAAMDEWYDPDAVHEHVARDDVTYLVATHDEGVVGYASGGPAEDDATATLGAIYVHPDHWGDGVGSTLLERFHARRRDHGETTVRLRVVAANRRAIAFYRSHGYAVRSERTTQTFGDRHTELVMERPLDQPTADTDTNQ